MNLLFGGVAIGFAPIFIKFLIFFNSSLVNLLVTVLNGGDVNNLMGNEFLSNITTGNPIATALVISMFIYMFIKLNIKFIVREFTLLVFTIFTPIVVGLWIINKNVTAAAIWSGQIMINVFMQFIYCFLFLLFSTFIGATSGWAVTLIWAMMLLPIADVLMNCLQNLTSRIAGLDNNEASMRAIGLGGVIGGSIGYSIGAIKTQFANKNTDNSGFIGRVKNFVNPQRNISSETDYNGNANPIRNVVENKPSNNQNVSNVVNNSTNSVINKATAGKVGSTAFKATKSYLKVGMQMAEGNFNTNSFEKKRNNNNSFIAKKNINTRIDKEKLNREKSDINEKD